MKYEIKKNPKLQIELTIEVSPDELQQYFVKAREELGKSLEVDGFRKGMAPKEIIEEKIGKENILIEAADLLVKDNYKKVISENKIEPISQPEIEIIKLALGNPFIFKAKFYILPEINLPDYKKIISSIKKNKISVENKEVDETLNWIQKSRANFISKDGPAEKGDFVEIEYSLNGLNLNPQNEKDSFILGEGQFLPGFEENIIGMKPSEKKEKISLKIPENYYNKDLAGKEIGANIKVLSVKKMELREINDDFAREVGNFKDLENLKESIKEGISLEKEHAEKERLRNEILEKLRNEISFEAPEVLIENEKKSMLEDFKESVLKNLKIPFEKYLEESKKTEEEIKNSFTDEAEKRVKNFLILRELVKAEDIKVSEDEINEEIDKILKQYPSKEKAEEELDYDKLKLYIENALINEKIFQRLENFIE